ncbi:MAG: fibrobacter succinogenes major paralogous domain-containing protein [Bacteroidales bacterium]|nr:fibrobacter succinogenes major paralogous domain-containing protein [Bacteroidales bacterium]
MKNSVNLIVFGILILSGIIHSCTKEELPTLSTSGITNITATTATGGGFVTSDGGAAVIARGICWSITENPSTADSKTTDGGGIGQYVSSITDINAGATYHVRAYATNNVGTAYGADIPFSTLGQLPSCLTQPATNLSATGVTLNGTVNANDLSTTVTFEYGATISYGQTVTATQSPVVGNILTNVSAVRTGLTTGATYHYRIKTVNSLGTEYGDDMVFSTLGQLPSCSTQPATDITTTDATLYGTVNANDLSTTVTFEYGTTASYGQTVTATQSPINGNAIIIVSANISGLTEGTTYHFRIKTVNTLGTSYGDDKSFLTLGTAPICTTQPATDPSTTVATLNGTVNPCHLSTIVTFEYGTTTNYGQEITAIQSPITENSVTNVSSKISGLTSGTTYHFRVKATNSLGTTYGDDMTFQTLSALPTVTDIDGNVYNTIILGSQVWLNENLRTSHYNNGDAIPTTLTLTDLTQTVNPKYQWTVNNPNDNTVPESKCYTWYVIDDDRGVCPMGYRVASNDDWNILEAYLADNGYGNSISKYNVAKSIAASSGWLISYIEGTVGYQQELNNSTGFNILPYGGVSPESFGVMLGSYGRQPPFWTSTNKGDQLNIRAITKLINYQQSWIITSDYPKNWGFGVRCIKNN